MTSKEIREALTYDEKGYPDAWKGAPIYLGSPGHGARDLILIEIAAQLAEINEHLKLR